MRTRANPPEKKAADREASEFALTRAQRRRKKQSALPAFWLRQATAAASSDGRREKTIIERLQEMRGGFGWWRGWR